MEYWDLYDGDRNPLGRSHPRGTKKKKGEYTIVVEIYVLNTKRELLLTLRHPDKETYPSTWECTSGSALLGEDSLTAARRELFEETGISVSNDEIYFLETRKGESSFHDCYYVVKDVNIEDLVMQEGETVEAKWVKVCDFPYVENLAEPIRNRAIAHIDMLMKLSQSLHKD